MDTVTEQLRAWQAGDEDAAAALLPEVYTELKAIAGRLMRGQAAAHTLQPTALAHEAWIKLAGSDADFNDRAHFFAVAARAMRQILVDHARALGCKKRAGGARVSLRIAEGEQIPADERMLALDAGLAALEATAPRAARATELRYFGGMSQAEIGIVLNISRATVDRDLRFARAWLAGHLA